MCDIDGVTDEAEANAALIAAAPALLEACQMGLQDAKDAASGAWIPSREGWESIIEHLTHVLARAENKPGM